MERQKLAEPSHKSECREGPEAAQQFELTMARVLTVSKDELTKREAAYKKSRRAKKTRARRKTAGR